MGSTSERAKNLPVVKMEAGKETVVEITLNDCVVSRIILIPNELKIKVGSPDKSKVDFIMKEII